MRNPGLTVVRMLGVVALVSALSAGAYASGGNGPASASDSMGPMRVAGVEQIDNFGLVDGHIYRGEQPKPEEYAALKALGISTIIDLRQDAKEYARASAEAAGLKYVNIPMDDKDTPYDNQIAAFLEAVTDPSNGKVYVHCAGGRHRTGATIATYRMAVNGWTADRAYAEMKAYDFYTRFGHGGYKDYVFDYYTRMQKDPASVPMAYVTPHAAEIGAAVVSAR